MGLEHSHWEKSHRVFLLWICSPVNVLYCISFCLLCRLTKYTIVGTALGPTLTVGMLAIGSGGDSQTLFSPGHQCRSTEVRSRDCSDHVPEPTVGTMEAVHTLALPNPLVNVPTNPTAAKARPATAAGALFLLDVL